jgi:hypothetical protein
MMEEIHNAIEIEDFDFYDGKPAGERWAPVGANDLDDETACDIQRSNRYVCFHKQGVGIDECSMFESILIRHICSMLTLGNE